MFQTPRHINAIEKFHAECEKHDPGVRLTEITRLAILQAVADKMSSHDIQRINAAIGKPIDHEDPNDDDKLSKIREYLEVCAVSEPFVQTEVIDVIDITAQQNNKLLSEWENEVNGAFMPLLAHGVITEATTDEELDALLTPVFETVAKASERVFQEN